MHSTAARDCRLLLLSVERVRGCVCVVGWVGVSLPAPSLPHATTAMLAVAHSHATIAAATELRRVQAPCDRTRRELDARARCGHIPRAPSRSCSRRAQANAWSRWPDAAAPASSDSTAASAGGMAAAHAGVRVTQATMREAVMEAYLEARSKRSGWDNYSSFEYALACIDRVLPRSTQQRRVHHAAVRTCLRLFFSPEEFQRNASSILDYFKVSGELLPELCVVANRRFGKTYAVAMLAAALLFACPNTKIRVFSTNLRTSVNLISYIAMFLKMIPETRTHLGMEITQLRITLGNSSVLALPSGTKVRPAHMRGRTEDTRHV